MTDIMTTLLNSFVLALFSAITLGFSFTAIRSSLPFLGLVEKASAPGLKTGLLASGLFALSVVFIFEFVWYVKHRLFHVVPILWAIHKTHHSATSLTLATSSRFHPIEFLIDLGIVRVSIDLALYCFLVAGFKPSNLDTGWAMFFILLSVLSPFFHSHIPISFGFMEVVLSSPVMHQVHHSKLRHHLHKNYGYHFSIFDRIFSTLYTPVRGEEIEPGLAWNSDPNSDKFLESYLWYPIRDVCRSLRKGEIFRFRSRPKS